MAEQERKTVLTHHAIERAKGRCGLSKRAARRMAEKAWKQGLDPAMAQGAFRRYLDGIYLKHKTAERIKVYGLHVYLFTLEGVLITIYHVPGRFRSAAQKMGGKHGSKGIF